MKFKEFAENCPWATSLYCREGKFLCRATREGFYPGICSEKECGLFYMLKIIEATRPDPKPKPKP